MSRMANNGDGARDRAVPPRIPGVHAAVRSLRASFESEEGPEQTAPARPLPRAQQPASAPTTAFDRALRRTAPVPEVPDEIDLREVSGEAGRRSKIEWQRPARAGTHRPA